MRLNEIHNTDLKLSNRVMNDNFNKIFKSCQPFLNRIDNEVKYYPMYRGLKIPKTVEIGVKAARLTNRTPKDSSPLIHDSFNRVFNEQYGHPYRNGVFASGDYHTAAAYGDGVYAIFPIGEFDYIWHEEIKDLYVMLAERGNDLTYEYARLTHDINPEDENFEEEFDKFVGEIDYGDLLEFAIKKYGDYHTQSSYDDLTAGISCRAEIMVWTPKYYVMKPEYLEPFQQWIKRQSK